MKITSICAKGFLGADDVSIDMREPVLLVAGPNAAGKSSIRDAIALAMTADLCRVKLKGDAGDLVTDGYQSAAVLIGTEQDGDYSVEITKAGKIKDGSKGRETPPALPILLDPERFATMSPADRQSLLLICTQN